MILTVTPNPLLDYQIHCSGPLKNGGVRVDSLPYTVGGKGINVARMLKTLGKPGLAFTFTGGSRGNLVRKELLNQGLACKFVHTQSETRVGVNLFMSDPVFHSWWIEHGQELQENEVEEMISAVSPMLASTSHIAMSGTVPGKNNNDFYARMLKACSAKSMEIYIDATSEPLIEACEVGGFFLKHNRDEAIESFGLDPVNPDQRQKLLQKFRSCNIWGAMITDGASKVLLWDGTNAIELMPPRVDEVSCVGCGDATLAGLIYGRSTGMNFVQAARLGLACGVADALKAGPCEADYADIQRFLSIMSQHISASD